MFIQNSIIENSSVRNSGQFLSDTLSEKKDTFEDLIIKVLAAQNERILIEELDQQLLQSWQICLYEIFGSFWETSAFHIASAIIFKSVENSALDIILEKQHLFSSSKYYQLFSTLYTKEKANYSQTNAQQLTHQPKMSDAVKKVRRKAYTKARAYWVSVGDLTKAELTDEELDESFARFDEEGIPRLKAELKSLEPPIGSLAYAAKIAQESNLHTGNPNLASLAEEILNDEFADYLVKRMRGEDAAE